MLRLLIAVTLVFLTTTAHAAASKSLTHFFNKVQTYSARFDQVVLDEGLNIVQESSGRLWIDRPGRFRWDYDTPLKQHIVGDGKKIWVYDVELQQVTVRKMSGALGTTPALLLAGKGNLSASFRIKEMGTQGNLEWVQMIPLSSDGGFEDIRIGFDKNVIRSLELVDGFGQTTRITLREPQENKKIDAARFAFTPPKGVDVIGE